MAGAFSAPMVASWVPGFLASLIISISFLAVAIMLGVNMSRTRQWARNPLAVGTLLLYGTCAGGHAVHTLQLIEPSLGFLTQAGAAARLEYGSFHTWFWDAVTAAAGVLYWMLRGKFHGLVSGAAVFEDLRERRRRALEVHDGVIAGLERAQRFLADDRFDEGRQEIGTSLEAAKNIISDLLANETIVPSSLRREYSAGQEPAHV